jgi:ATP-dependent helicase/nuclease subunit B
MDDPHALPQQIQQALARGWTVLTANQRAARTLRRAFDRDQRTLRLANWQPPPILAWDTWTATLWRRLLLEGHATALLLNPTQEHTLWCAIIDADRHADTAATLRPIDSLAELAAGAWLLLHAYQGRRRLQSATDSSDTRAFARWAVELERRCARSNYLTQAQLPETLRTTVTTGNLILPSGFLLVGFDAKTPAQAALLEAVATSGTQIEESHVGRSGTPSIHSLVAATDEHEELTSAARWLRTHLAINPTARLAVIVPNLDAQRPQLDRIFRPILAPELEDIAAPPNSGPFEFSLGIPLAQTPMAAAALDILRWAIVPLPLDRVSALLLSPHFAAGPVSEHLTRAEFDAFTLRRQPFLQPQVPLNDLLDLISHSKWSADLPILLKHLRTLRPLVNKKDLITAERTHADWAATIHDLLEAAGWASTSRHDSVEFQTRRKWESVLDELATLDFNTDLPRVPFTTALAALERIAAQTLFAPESRHAPIQIMGPLEAAGSTFDALWFLHAGDLAWPSTSSPNPLLPWHLQRELLMPGVDPARDAAHARRITERIAASAPNVLFSYAQQTPDGHQRLSPTLASLSLEPHTAAEIAPAHPSAEPISLEAHSDDTPIPPPPERVFQGGAGILASQAACGFRAFAEKRLFSSALDDRELGLDPRERGNVVHKVLEGFWANVETQAALRLMTPIERKAMLLHSIDDALKKHAVSLNTTWNRAYLDTERQRLIQLLNPWLDYELTRAPFAVQSREAELKDVQIGPLRLDIRVDRIDTLLVDGEPSGEIILDYKTGAAHPAHWLGDRPDAPQLPLYAVVSESPQLAAVAFASVRRGTPMEINGYEAHKGVLPKSTRLKTASLEAQVDEWRTTLTTLAEAFYSGDAKVAPRQYPTTCRYCEQRLLCRLDVATLEADAIEELTADGDSDEVTEASRG